MEQKSMGKEFEWVPKEPLVIAGTATVKSVAKYWGLANDNTPQFFKARKEDLAGKLVFGMISYDFASVAFANIRYWTTGNQMNKGHLSLEDLLRLSTPPSAFMVEEIEMPKKFDMVATRHYGVYDYLVKQGIIEDGVPCFRPDSPWDVEDKTVFGYLPFNFAAMTREYARIDFQIPWGMRHLNFTAEELGKFPNEKPMAFRVAKVHDRLLKQIMEIPKLCGI